MDLEKLWGKVDLTMASLSMVREEQVMVVKYLKMVTRAHGVPAGDGIMGAAPSAVASSSAGMNPPPQPPPAPLPSDRILRSQQVNPILANSRLLIHDVAPLERCRRWIFPTSMVLMLEFGWTSIRLLPCKSAGSHGTK
jgi:hypothetical protein